MSSTSSLEARKAAALHFLRELSIEGTDPDAFDDLVTPDCVVHYLDLPHGPAGPKRLKAFVSTFIDFRWEIQDLFGEGDRVVVRALNHAVHKVGGTWEGIPGHGQTVDFETTWIFLFAGDRIAQVWRIADDLGRLPQLGATITPPRE